MSTFYALLKSRALIRLAGSEVNEFLQGLLTADVMALRVGHPHYAALLSAQGKVQFDMHLWRGDDTAILIDCEAAHRDELIKRLKLFRLRAKIDIEPADEMTVAAAWGEALRHPLAKIPEGAAFDPRMHDLGIRLLTTADNELEQDWSEQTEAAYTAHRLSLGVPEGRSELGYEKLFALEANLEELKAVSFKKGCYVGQELTARMKHKTDLRKRLLPLALSGPVAPGAPITAADRDIGQLIGLTEGTGFALIRLDRLDGVLEGDVTAFAGDQPAHIQWPAAYLAPPPR